jgi:hypothetical protein
MRDWTGYGAQPTAPSPEHRADASKPAMRRAHALGLAVPGTGGERKKALSHARRRRTRARRVEIRTRSSMATIPAKPLHAGGKRDEGHGRRDDGSARQTDLIRDVLSGRIPDDRSREGLNLRVVSPVFLPLFITASREDRAGNWPARKLSTPVLGDKLLYGSNALALFGASLR